jgi:hypothetical protein
MEKQTSTISLINKITTSLNKITGRYGIYTTNTTE